MIITYKKLYVQNPAYRLLYSKISMRDLLWRIFHAYFEIPRKNGLKMRKTEKLLRKRRKQNIVLPVLLLLGVVLLAGCILYPKDQSAAAAGQSDPARIPRLEPGTEVYSMQDEILSVLGAEAAYISTDRSSGSGIVWSYDGDSLYVVTAGHLMQDFTSGTLELWSGDILNFTPEDVHADADSDIAVICLEGQKDLELGKADMTRYLAEEVPESGTDLWIIDSAYGPACDISACFIEITEYYLDDFGQSMLILQGAGRAGMSGCGVYDTSGRLVAMMSGMSEDQTTLAAVPFPEIVNFFETLMNKVAANLT